MLFELYRGVGKDILVSVCACVLVYLLQIVAHNFFPLWLTGNTEMVEFLVLCS